MADPKIRYDIAAHAEGGGEVDKLAASFEKLDQSIDPAAAARAQELAAELQRLGAQQQAVARFQELSEATERARANLSAADAAVAALRAEIEASGAPTTAQAGRIEKLGAAAQTARTEVQAQATALEASRGRLAALGIDSAAAAKAETDLAAATRTTRAELQALGQSLQGVHARELVDELRQLGQQQAGIQQLRDLGTATDKARSALTSAEQAAEAYRTRIAGIEAPTAAQVNQQQRLGFAVDDARAKFTSQSAALEAARSKLASLGVETGDLAGAEERLRTAAQGTLQQIEALGQQQAAVQRFAELAASTERTRAALTAADAAVESFRSGMAGAGAPTAAEATELQRLADAAERTRQEFARQDAALSESRAAVVALRGETAALAVEAQRTAAAGDRISEAWQALGARGFGAVQAEATKVRAALQQIQATSRDPVEIQVATEIAEQRLRVLDQQMAGLLVTARAAGTGIGSGLAAGGPGMDALAAASQRARSAIDAAGSSAGRFEAELEQLRAVQPLDASLAERARQIAASLQELGQQQQAVARFAELRAGSEEARQALAAAQTAAQAYAREINAAGAPTAAQTARLEVLAAAVRAARADELLFTQALDGSRAKLSEFGITTDGLARTQAGLRTAVAGTLADLRSLGEQQAAVSRFRELSSATEAARAALVASETALDGFRTRIAGVAEPTALEARELGRLTEAARAAQIAVQEAASAQAEAGATLRAAAADAQRFEATQQTTPARLQATAAATREVAAGYAAVSASATASADQQTAAAARVGTGLQAVEDRITALQRQEIAVSGLQRLQADAAASAAELARTRTAAEQFAAALGEAGPATEGEAERLQQLRAAAAAAAEQFAAQSAAVDAARAGLALLGGSTATLARDEAALQVALEATRAELQALGAGYGQAGAAASTSSAQQVAAAGRVSDGLQQIGERLDALTRREARLTLFAGLQADAERARREFETTQATLSVFEAGLGRAGTATAAEAAQLETLRAAARTAGDAVTAASSAVDAAGATLGRMGLAAGTLAGNEEALAAALRETRTELAAVASQAQAAQVFETISRETDAARRAMVEADAALTSYRRSLGATAAPTQQEAEQLQRLTAAAAAAGTAFRSSAQAQEQAGAALRTAVADTERLVASQQRVPPALTATAAAAQQVAAAYRAEGAAATASATQQVAANSRAAASLEGIKGSLDSIRNLGVAGILGSQTAQLLRGVAETSDAYENLRARIKLVTGDGPALQAAFEGVYQVALRTNSTLEGTGTLFARIAQAGKEIGVGQAQALQLTESINQAIQLSGGSAQAADAAVTQLIQGLQSGVLRGEEFNSVMEQAPRLAQALAAGLGVTTGELRKLANEGQLTSATVIQALQGQAAVLRGEFQTLPATVGRAVQNLRTEWEKLVGTFNDGTGTTAVVAQGINKIAANLDTIARLATEAGATLLAALAIKGVAALRALSGEATLATATMTALGTAISRIPTVVNVAIAVTGFEIGFQIGEMLRENSELARKLGVGVTEFLTGLVSDLQFVKEAAAAVFTDDTISAAFDRYKARAEQQRAIFRDLYDDAKKSPEEIRRAALAAADATAGVGSSAAAAGAQVRDAAQGAAGGYGALTAAAGGAGAAVSQVGQGAAASGAQVASAGAAGAAGLKPIVAGAAEAQAAILDLATAAKVQLPTIGLTAAQQATIIADVAAKSRSAADVIRTELPAAIAKLSGAGLEQFRAAFAAAFEASIRNSQRLADSLGGVGEAADKALAAAQSKASLLQAVLAETGKRAAETLGVDIAGLATGLSAEFQKAEDNLSVLIRSMPALKAAGIDAGAAVAQALAKMIDGAKSQAELDAIQARVQALAESLQITGAEGAGALQQIADKGKLIREAFEDATPGIQGLAEAARKAGVDFGELTTGVSKGFSDGVRDVTALATEIDKAGISAQRASPILAQALNKALETARTKEEVDLLRKVIEQAGASGKLFGTDFTAALDAVKRKAEEVSPALRQAQADAERLGITLHDNIAQGAESGVNSAITSYERLKASGKASAAELDAAFVTVAKEAIAATGGIVPEWIKVEAATRGAIVATDEYGRTTIESMANARAAIAQVATAAAGLSSTFAERNAEFARQIDQAKALQDSINHTVADNTGLASLQAKQLAGTLGPDDLATAQSVLEVERQNLALAQQYGAFVSGAGYRDAIARYNQARQLAEQASAPGLSGTRAPYVPPAGAVKNGNAGYVSFGGAAAPAPASSPTPAPAPAPAQATPSTTTTYTTNVTIGGKQYGIGTTNKASADKLIEALEEAYRASGLH